MKVTVQDILPMDKGSGAATAYELDDRFIDFLMEKPERMEYLVGHIHSHHSMAVYFSSVDTEEIHDNSAAHNFYLSLIVNNFGEMTAKIAFRTKREIKTTIPEYAFDENGTKYLLRKDTIDDIVERVCVYDCDIKSKSQSIRVDDDFAKKVDGIINVKKPVVGGQGMNPMGFQRTTPMVTTRNSSQMKTNGGIKTKTVRYGK